MEKSSEYNAWVNLRARCNNPNHPEYFRYGGRGITCCESWNSFKKFIDDMGLKPHQSYSIERIDNNLGYCKDNCKWDSKASQSFNQRKSKDNTSGIVGVHYELKYARWKAFIGFNGKKITLGRFKNLFDACCARKAAEIFYYGEY